MVKNYSRKRAINKNLKTLMLCSLLICYAIWLLVQTTVFAYQPTEINPFGLTFSLDDDFIIYKNVNHIDNNFKDELGNDDLYFYAESEHKSMSIQIWMAGESEHVTINNLNENQISKIMRDIDILGVAEGLMIKSSIKTSLQTYNGQKYYMVRGYFNETPDVFGEYAVTINNGYIVWYQIFHYDIYSQKNTSELLDSFEFTENKNFFSNTTKLINKKKDMRNDAFAKGVVEYIFYALIIGCFVLVKKFWKKLVGKNEDDNEQTSQKDVSINDYPQRNICDSGTKIIENKEEMQPSNSDKKCEMCDNHVEHLTYCEIKDEYGKRYRYICNECISKYNAKQI